MVDDFKSRGGSPWGSPPGGGNGSGRKGPTPPDIDEIIRTAQEKIKKFLISKEGGQETADEEMSFIEKSIGAVPTYFINNKYIIQGGQEPETFVSFLNKILIKEKENAATG